MSKESQMSKGFQLSAEFHMKGKRKMKKREEPKEKDSPAAAEAACRNVVNEFMVERARRAQAFSMDKPHYHPYYELYFLISGSCRMFIDHTIYYLSAGDIVMLAPYQLHQTIYGSGQIAERFTANFVPAYIEYFVSQCSEDGLASIFSRHKLSVPKEQQDYVKELFLQMSGETLSNDCYSRIQLKSLLFQFLTFLGRCRGPEQPDQALEPDDAVIQDAARYIYLHHSEPLTLESVAEAAHMSPAWFSRKFHRAVGLGFKEYLTHVRLENAEELLLTTSLSVTEIALICGFSNGNYFGDAFKKARGISPREFRFSGHAQTGNDL